MKLKTMKDFPTEIIKFDDGINKYSFEVISKEILRQSTINDIKELSKGDNLIITNGLPSTDTRSIIFNNVEKKALILWLKWKFNITEDELK